MKKLWSDLDIEAMRHACPEFAPPEAVVRKVATKAAALLAERAGLSPYDMMTGLSPALAEKVMNVSALNTLLEGECAVLRSALERECITLSETRSWCKLCRTEHHHPPGAYERHQHATECPLQSCRASIPDASHLVPRLTGQDWEALVSHCGGMTLSVGGLWKVTIRELAEECDLLRRREEGWQVRLDNAERAQFAAEKALRRERVDTDTVRAARQKGHSGAFVMGHFDDGRPVLGGLTWPGTDRSQKPTSEAPSHDDQLIALARAVTKAESKVYRLERELERRWEGGVEAMREVCLEVGLRMLEVEGLFDFAERFTAAIEGAAPHAAPSPQPTQEAPLSEKWLENTLATIRAGNGNVASAELLRGHILALTGQRNTAVQALEALEKEQKAALEQIKDAGIAPLGLEDGVRQLRSRYEHILSERDRALADAKDIETGLGAAAKLALAGFERELALRCITEEIAAEWREKAERHAVTAHEHEEAVSMLAAAGFRESVPGKVRSLPSAVHKLLRAHEKAKNNALRARQALHLILQAEYPQELAVHPRFGGLLRTMLAIAHLGVRGSPELAEEAAGNTLRRLAKQKPIQAGFDWGSFPETPLMLQLLPWLRRREFIEDLGLGLSSPPLLLQFNPLPVGLTP